MQPEKKYKLTIDESSGNQRLDRFLASQLEDHSRSFYQKLVRDGFVRINGKVVKSSYRLNLNDIVEIELPPPQETNILPEDIPLEIVYQDADLLVVNKQAGMVVHPGAGVHSGTLVNALMYHCKDLSGVGGRLRPGIVHRLDKNTSGLLVVAKNDRAHIQLQQQFADKSASRDYKTLVWGIPKEPDGVIENFINRSKSDRKKFTVAPDGKHAITHYEVADNFEFTTLLNISLKTGRTHQIRVHMNYIHHPVFGDPDYSGRKSQIKRLSALSEKNFALYLLKSIDRQALHAYRLTFVHPARQEAMTFTAPLPGDMKNVIEKLKQ